MRIIPMLPAMVVGIAAGSLVNIGLVELGPHIIAPPGGVDTTSVEAIKASLHLFRPRHYLFPFLAHALGTFTGAWIAGRLAPGGSRLPAWLVGFAFLGGGIASIVMLPAPLWFGAVDLILAYLPMAWLAQRLVARLR